MSFPLFHLRVLLSIQFLSDTLNSCLEHAHIFSYKISPAASALLRLFHYNIYVSICLGFFSSSRFVSASNHLRARACMELCQRHFIYTLILSLPGWGGTPAYIAWQRRVSFLVLVLYLECRLRTNQPNDFVQIQNIKTSNNEPRKVINNFFFISGTFPQ